jgi:hypothetical protein
MRLFKQQRDSRPEIEEADPLRREPMPTEHAILWRPLPDSYHLLASMLRTPTQQAQLFVTQRAFLQVERHLGSAPDLELGGFLAGHRCLCPRLRAPYSVINTVIPFAEVTGEPIRTGITPAAHDAVQRRLQAHRLDLIGWYRNGAELGLQLLPDDIETHVTYFDRPWQTTLLVVPDPSKAKGAFFTYDARVGRSFCIPFYELFDKYAANSNRAQRTCVKWTTYVAAARVEPLPEAERDVVESTIAATRIEPDPEPTEPLDEWLDAIKDPWVRLKDAAIGAPRRDETLPLVYEPAVRTPDPVAMPYIPPARPPAAVEERGVPYELNAASPPPAAPQHTGTLGTEPSRRVPPFAGPQRHASAPSVPQPRTPARSTTAPRPIPPATVAALQRAAAPPPVALPPDFHDDAKRWERWRRIGFTMAAVSFLAALVLFTARSRSQTVAQAATSAEPLKEVVLPVLPASENAVVIIPLASAIDSLSGALAYYRAVADDHREGRVSCRVLDRAYVLVGRARHRVTSAREQVTENLADADSIRLSMLGAEYTHVDQTYRRSDCQS